MALKVIIRYYMFYITRKSGGGCEQGKNPMQTCFTWFIRKGGGGMRAARLRVKPLVV